MRRGRFTAGTDLNIQKLLAPSYLEIAGELRYDLSRETGVERATNIEVKGTNHSWDAEYETPTGLVEFSFSVNFTVADGALVVVWADDELIWSDSFLRVIRVGSIESVIKKALEKMEI